MTLLQTIVLALVQGLTEFLPISSSGHLILAKDVFHWPDQGVAFDVAVHMGTLSAVVWYFRKEINAMTRDWFSSIAQRRMVGESRLAWAVLWGTIPAGLVGLLLHDFINNHLRTPVVIAYTTIGFGLLLWFADKSGAQQRDEHSIRWKDVLIVGLAQALALVPGTSRSGITMTAALLLGLNRTAAARFSFLLSIPIIVLAGGYETKKLLAQTTPVDWNALLIGTILSAITAYLCIHFFLKLLDRIGMLPFVIYRLLLGVVLLAIFV
ncbi:MAG: undecaprenyl-diphosphate phosphatase [Gammaproteobacteria bacterium]|nr:undecaprenyl-diphosphate phosphatase [Gammaproteobacteria bacterium]MDH5653974.1 undecaprenyl-diphosphate phosphatase [Gammaproteobacteria bacterium]